MFRALMGGWRVPPTKTGQRGLCPCCKEAVIAHVGEMVSPYWSHHVNANCDPWYTGKSSGPMSEWHHEWQSKVPDERREVVITRDAVTHVADVVTPSGYVVEFQHSSIPVSEVAEREQFYGRGVWVVDMHDRECAPSWVKHATTWTTYYDYGDEWLAQRHSGTRVPKSQFVAWMNGGPDLPEDTPPSPTWSANKLDRRTPESRLTCTPAESVEWQRKRTAPILDWGHGRTNWPMKPCTLCGRPAIMIDPGDKRPKHKVCAERHEAYQLP